MAAVTKFQSSETDSYSDSKADRKVLAVGFDSEDESDSDAGSWSNTDSDTEFDETGTKHGSSKYFSNLTASDDFHDYDNQMNSNTNKKRSSNGRKYCIGSIYLTFALVLFFGVFYILYHLFASNSDVKPNDADSINTHVSSGNNTENSPNAGELYSVNQKQLNQSSTVNNSISDSSSIEIPIAKLIGDNESSIDMSMLTSKAKPQSVKPKPKSAKSKPKSAKPKSITPGPPIRPVAVVPVSVGGGPFNFDTNSNLGYFGLSGPPGSPWLPSDTKKPYRINADQHAEYVQLISVDMTVNDAILAVRPELAGTNYREVGVVDHNDKWLLSPSYKGKGSQTSSKTKKQSYYRLTVPEFDFYLTSVAVSDNIVQPNEIFDIIADQPNSSIGRDYLDRGIKDPDGEIILHARNDSHVELDYGTYIDVELPPLRIKNLQQDDINLYAIDSSLNNSKVSAYRVIQSHFGNTYIGTKGDGACFYRALYSGIVRRALVSRSSSSSGSSTNKRHLLTNFVSIIDKMDTRIANLRNNLYIDVNVLGSAGHRDDNNNLYSQSKREASHFLRQVLDQHWTFQNFMDTVNFNASGGNEIDQHLIRCVKFIIASFVKERCDLALRSANPQQFEMIPNVTFESFSMSFLADGSGDFQQDLQELLRITLDMTEYCLDFAPYFASWALKLNQNGNGPLSILLVGIRNSTSFQAAVAVDSKNSSSTPQVTSETFLYYSFHGLSQSNIGSHVDELVWGHNDAYMENLKLTGAINNPIGAGTGSGPSIFNHLDYMKRSTSANHGSGGTSSSYTNEHRNRIHNPDVILFHVTGNHYDLLTLDR